MVQTIEIQQFNVQYNVARSLDNPASIQRRLDHIASQLLAQMLEHQLAQLNDTDGALYFIEQLHFDLPLDLTQRDDRQLATAWAGALYTSIQRTLSHSGMGVIRFRDRSAFIASFLEDLMQGRAWDCWYYDEFTDLQSVSVSQAVLNVLTLDGDVGREALLELTRRDSLERLLIRLTDAEVEAIANQCLLPLSPGVILPDTCEVWIRELRSLLNRGFTLTSIIAKDTTRLYLGLLRQRPDLGPDVNLARFIQSLLHLRQTVMGLGDRAAFLAQLAADNWTEALHSIGRSPLQSLLRTLAREVAGTDLVELLQDLQVEEPQPLIRRMVTAYGGIFLLAGAIADLEIHHFLQGCPYPEPEGISKPGLLLFAILLQCLGYQNAIQAIREPGLALFAGLTKPLEKAQLQSYAEHLTPDMHSVFMQQFETHRDDCLNRPALFMLSRLPRCATSDWFSLSSGAEPLLADSEWDAALSTVSATVLQGFAAKLGAFSDSSPSFLCRNFLESQAEIEIYTDGITVHFLTCPLQMVLRMAGFDHNTWTVPWLENRSLSFEFD